MTWTIWHQVHQDLREILKWRLFNTYHARKLTGARSTNGVVETGVRGAPHHHDIGTYTGAWSYPNDENNHTCTIRSNTSTYDKSNRQRMMMTTMMLMMIKTMGDDDDDEMCIYWFTKAFLFVRHNNSNKGYKQVKWYQIFWTTLKVSKNVLVARMQNIYASGYSLWVAYLLLVLHMFSNIQVCQVFGRLDTCCGIMSYTCLKVLQESFELQYLCTDSEAAGWVPGRASTLCCYLQPTISDSCKRS